MKITTNGTHTLKTKGKASVLYVFGDLSGGTATLGFMGEGVFYPLKDDTDTNVILVIGEPIIVTHGQSMNLHVELTGASGPSLSVVAKVVE